MVKNETTKKYWLWWICCKKIVKRRQNIAKYQEWGKPGNHFLKIPQKV